MAVNHKLTSIIKGRVVRASEADASGVQITFKDSSTMKVKTAGSQAASSKERTLTADNSLRIELAN